MIMSLLQLPNDILREIIGYLYHEHKFNISALGALANTCQYMNHAISLNGDRSPVTKRDIARRKYINQLRTDPTMLSIATLVNQPLSNLNIKFLLTIIPYDIILILKTTPDNYCHVTENPMITIEILLDLIDRKPELRGIDFRLRANSIITAQELESRGLKCATRIVATLMQHYRKTGLVDHTDYNNRIECDIRTDYIYIPNASRVCFELGRDKNVPIEVLHKYRDKYDVKSINVNESARWLESPEYCSKYVHEYLTAQLRANDYVLCCVCDINFIINNPQYSWNWSQISDRADVTFELLRKYPHLPWVYNKFNPVYDNYSDLTEHYESASPRAQKLQSLFEMTLNGTLTMDDIIATETDIKWDYMILIKVPELPIASLLEHYNDKITNRATTFYILSLRKDVTIEHVKKFTSFWWNLSEFDCLKKYSCVNF